jgi:hypothetical protein
VRHFKDTHVGRPGPDFLSCLETLAVGHEFRPSGLHDLGQVFRMLFAKTVQEPDEKFMVQAGGVSFSVFGSQASLSEFFPALRVGFFDNDNVLLFFPRGENAPK